MKKYEKPRLMALSLSGNDALCACAYDVVGENASEAIKRVLQFLNDPRYSEPDGTPKPNTFNADAECEIVVPLDGYCKFGPSGAIIFNS